MADTHINNPIPIQVDKMNLEHETRCGYEISRSMKRVWDVQLDLLKQLLEVCNKHNLRIWAEGGTLLGTIRHKGYIPWDDDIDMMMLREDYENLVSIAPKAFNGKYFFQCAETERGYFRGHAQLRRSDTTAILPGDLWQNFNQGIFIDIFVFDFLPSTKEERIQCFKKLEEKRALLYNKYYGSLFSRTPFKYILSHLKIGNAEDCLRVYKNMVEGIVSYKNKSKKEIGSILWTTNGYEKYIRKFEWYNQTIYLPFENIKIPVPANFDDILKCQYGDYMKPVKAPTCHGEVIFSVDEPYKNVLSRLRKNASFKMRMKRLFSFYAFNS